MIATLFKHDFSTITAQSTHTAAQPGLQQ